MKKRPVIVGVMGGSLATDSQQAAAERVGALVADCGAVLLCGGGGGVMEYSAKGASEAGGLTVGVLPGRDKNDANPYISIPLATNIGDARNAINILSSDLVVAIGGSGGTLSEIALAIKNGRKVLGFDTCRPVFSDGRIPESFVACDTVEELLAAIREGLDAV